MYFNFGIEDRYEQLLDNITYNYGGIDIYYQEQMKYFEDNDFIFRLNKIKKDCHNYYKIISGELKKLISRIEELYKFEYGDEDKESDFEFYWEQGLDLIEEDFYNLIENMGDLYQWDNQYDFNKLSKKWIQYIDNAHDKVKNFIEKIEQEIKENRIVLFDTVFKNKPEEWKELI